jgi:hypothetical protein
MRVVFPEAHTPTTPINGGLFEAGGFCRLLKGILVKPFSNTINRPVEQEGEQSCGVFDLIHLEQHA